MVRTGQDYGNVVVMVSLIIIAGLFFYFGTETKTVVDCSQVQRDCYWMNRYYLSCPELWDEMVEMGCQLINVTQLPIERTDVVDYEKEYNLSDMNWSWE